MLEKLKHKIAKLLDGAVPEEYKEKFLEMLFKKKEEELKNSPKIAIIGKTGVGKSSTINALFGTKLSFSHTEACTKTAEPVILSNGKGEIIVFDMPGLGEDIDKDLEHMKTYERVLPECDIVLWILNIEDREMAYQQTLIKQILPLCDDRMVVCANKADIIYPNNWNERGNFPSEEQLENLRKRIIDIRSKLSKVLSAISEEQIVFYSAIKRYKLPILFNAMMQACPKHRAWVLEDRKDLADFKELMDQDLLKEYLDSRTHLNLTSNE